MSDRIVFDIDYSSLEAALSRLDQAIKTIGPIQDQQGLFTPSGILEREAGFRRIADTPPAAGQVTLFMSQLEQEVYKTKMLKEMQMRLFPAVSRDIRLMVTGLPVTQEMMRFNFMMRRLERGLILGGFTGILSVSATVIILLRMVADFEKRLTAKDA